MATTTNDAKTDIAPTEGQKIEDLGEKGTNLSNSSGDLENGHMEYSEAEAAAVLRKVDYRLVPLLAVLYLISFIDRSNIGNAKIAGMTRLCADKTSFTDFDARYDGGPRHASQHFEVQYRSHPVLRAM
jgi:hypothetical protein